MKLRIYILLLGGLLLTNKHLIGSSTQSSLDSILQEVNKIENDSDKIDRLTHLVWELRRSKPDLSLKLLDTSEYLLENEITYEFMKGRILTLKANLFSNTGNKDKMIESYQNAINFFEGYSNHENEKIRSTAIRNISACYNNLAETYSESGDEKQALKFYKESLDLIKDNGTKSSISTRYFNMGLSYINLLEFDSAEYYITQSHIIETELNDPVGLYWSNFGFGRIRIEQGLQRQARSFFEKAINYAKESDDKASVMECMQWVAESYKRDSNYQEAANNYMRSLKLAKELGFTNYIPNIYYELAVINNSRGNLKLSNDFYQKYIELTDSLTQLESEQKLAEFQAEFEDEKKQQRIALLEKDKEFQQTQKKFMWGGIAAILIVLGLVFNSFLSSKKNNKKLALKNETIRARNDEINLKNLQITDSINYAQKIQNAILPTIEQFKKHFDDAFIFYKPKDIVSGDFYWGYSINDKVIFTAADCTGHGVPGAFMSLIGSNILDKIVGELNITEPNNILDQLSIEIHTRLSADNPQKIKDGMDLSIFSVDKKTLKLQVAGAYNPVYLVRNNELIQFKADKLQIGNPEQIGDRKFNMQEYQLQKGDTLYLFSDGFPDQKGGPDGKKFFYPPFRDLLAGISNKPMDQQQAVLEKTITEWMGNKEQQDDMLILGVKI